MSFSACTALLELCSLHKHHMTLLLSSALLHMLQTGCSQHLVCGTLCRPSLVALRSTFLLVPQHSVLQLHCTNYTLHLCPASWLFDLTFTRSSQLFKLSWRSTFSLSLTVSVLNVDSALAYHPLIGTYSLICCSFVP